MVGLLVLALITTFHPARPSVGDPITIDFASPATVDSSPDYEVIARNGNSVVIRTFVPHTITVSGHTAVGAITVMIPIHSVLKTDDKLEPAPLKPPREEPWPRLPFMAIGLAALAAIAAWTAVVLLAKQRAATPRVVVVPVDEFRTRVIALRSDRGAAMRWARLAGAVRAYLAAVCADWGAELTTSELLDRIEKEEQAERRRPAGWAVAGPAAVSNVAGEPPAVQPPSRRRYVAAILRQGDLEKFSPWGAAPADFEEIASQALEIPNWAEPPAEVATENAA
jgi:hypothetical protein